MGSKRLLLPLLLLVLAFAAKAQDAHFSQPHFSPTQLNPAFVSANDGSNAKVTYRNQWPGLSTNIQSIFASVDHTFGDHRNAIGISYLHNDESRIFQTNRLSFNYAYKLPLFKGLVMVQPAMQMTYFQKKLNWNRVTFGDQIDPQKGFIYKTQDKPRGGTVGGIGISSGLLIHTRSLLLGFSAFHLNTPNQSILQGQSSLPIRWEVQAGYTHEFDAIDLAINPYLLYAEQAGFQKILPGLRVQHKKYFLGLGYRIRDAVTFSGGFFWDRFRISYAYDLTVSELSAYQPGGAHEIGMSYQFLSRDPKKKIIPLQFNLN